MSDDALITEHDQKAERAETSVNYYLAELARRDQDRQTQAMVNYTRWITIMTGVMTVATLLNLGVAVAVLAQQPPQ